MRLAVLAITVSAFSLLLACPSAEPEPAAPEPGPFVAGHASARLPAPLGIGTAGSSPLSGPDSDSPYTVRFPATTKLHGHPDVRVVALSRGEGFEVVLARVDTIAAPQQIRDAVVAELLARTGRDYDDALVLSGTHSHNGPGQPESCSWTT